MLDIKFVRENPDIVKENIRKKFQNAKLPLVDEVIALDAEKRAAENEGNDLRAQRNKLSKQVGMLMGQAKKDPSKLEYLIFSVAADKRMILATAWINMSTVESAKSLQIVCTIEEVSAGAADHIRQLLASAGYKKITTEVKPVGQ